MSQGSSSSHFVGLRVPWPEGLDEVLHSAPAELRCVSTDDLHATLAFLGRMDSSRTDALLDTVAALEFEPIEVRFGSLVALPHRRRFSALAFELEAGQAQVARLIELHRDRLIRLALGRPDERPPYPHVTIARPPKRANTELSQRLLQWADGVEPPPGRSLLSEVFLYRTHPQGNRRFEVLGP